MLRRFGLVVLVIFSVGAVWSGSAFAWTSPVNVSGTTFDDRPPDGGIAGDQTSVVVWERDGFPYPLVQVRARSATGLLSPIEDVASGDHPVIAVNGAGTSALAWAREDAFGDRVRVSMRAGDGTLTSPVDASPAGSDVDAIDVGIAADGTAVIVWRRDGRVLARVRQPDGSFGPVATLSGAGAAEPVVAVAPSGESAVAWRLDDGATSRIEVARISTTGVAGPARALTTSGVADSPDVGIADNGAAVVVWHRPVSGVDRVQLRPVAPDGTAGTAQNLSPQGAPAIRPAVAVNPSGAAIAVWQRLSSGFWRVQAIPRSPAGTLGAHATLSTGGGDAVFPEIDLSGAGLGVAVWDRVGSTTYAQARSLQLDGTVGVLATIGNGRENVKGQPLVDVNETGGSMTSWHRFDGSVLRVRVAVGAPQVKPTTTPLVHAENDTQAIDPQLKVIDDNPQLTGATVAITDGYVNGQDVLGFTDQNGITGDFDSATGVLTLSGTASLDDYQTALRSVTYHNTSDAPSTATRKVSFSASDAAFTGDPATRAIDVTPVNDAPVVSTPGSAATYTEGGSAVAVDSTMTVSDVDSANLQGATAVIQSAVAGDRLNFTDQNGITGTFDAGTRTLTLSGAASVADYQSALRSVTFDSTSDDPTGATRTIDFTVTDSDGATSATDSQDVNVTPVNDAPVVSTPGSTATYTEGGSAVAVDSSLTVSDVDSNTLQGATAVIQGFVAGDRLNFTDQSGITGTFDAGTHTLTLTGNSSVANYQSALRSVTFDSTSNNPTNATRTIDFTVTDSDGATSATDSQNVNVTPVNTAPVVTTPGSTATYTENGSAVAVDSSLTVSDVDSANLQGATVVIQSAVAGDRLNFTNQNGISGSFDAATHTLSLSGASSVANYQSALRSVTFDSTSDDPTGATRTIDFAVTDSDGATSATDSQNVNVTPVNDKPVVTTSAGSMAYTENDPAKAIDTGLTASDVDSANAQGATVQITNNYVNGEDILAFTNTAQITGTFNASTATLTLSGSAPISAYQSALRSVTYRNTSENPSAATRTASFRLDDGSAANNLSDAATRTITVQPVNDPPVADNESFNNAQRAVGNTTLVVDDPSDGPPAASDAHKTITGDILDGDTDPDDSSSVLTVKAGTFATNDGGSVDVQSDGDFVFHPKAGTSCTDHSDFFDYTVQDDEPGTPGTGTGRVTIEIQDCVWYADSSLASNGDGRSNAPFNTLAGINGNGGAGDADSAGDRIFLYDGSYSSLLLENTQQLLGQRNGLSVPDGGGGTVTLEPAGGGNTTIAGGLTLATDNVIQGIFLGDASGNALTGTSVGNATMNTATSGAINNTIGGAVNITGGTLNMAFTSVSSSGSGTNGIQLTNAAGTFTANGGTLANAGSADVSLSGGSTAFTYDGTINDDVGSLVTISGQTGGTKDFNGAITDGNDGDGAGITLTNNTGATVRFDGGLTLSTGTNPAFAATGGGTVNVTDPAAADNTIATTSGTALNIANTTIGSDGATFRSIAANGAANGIVLNTTGSSGGLSVTGSGTTAGSGGTIQSVTNRGVSAISAAALSLANMNFTNDGSANGADPTIATSTCGDLITGSNTGCNAGVHMDGVSGATLTNLAVNGGNQIGINGNNVTNLSLSNSTIQNAGDQTREDGVRFRDLKGTSSIANSILQGNEDNQLRVGNGNGATGTLNISNSTFQNSTNPNGEYGFQLDTFGSGGFTTSISGSTFNNTRGGGLVATAQDTSTLNVSATGGTWKGNGGAISNFDSAIQVIAANSSNVKFNVHDITNPMVGYGLNVIHFQTNSPGTENLEGQVVRTAIGDASSQTSASSTGAGIGFNAQSTSKAKLNFSNNTIKGVSTFGITMQMGNLTTAATTVDATVQNNNVSVTPTSTSIQGIAVNSGTTSADPASGRPADTGTFCADISNNVASSANGDGLRVRQRFGTTVRLPGYAGGATDTTAINSFLATKNPSLGDTILATTQAPGSYAGGATGCAAPTLP